MLLRGTPHALIHSRSRTSRTAVHWLVLQRVLEFITELGYRLKLVTGDTLELTYLFQRLSTVMRRGNELCFNGTSVPR